MKYTVCFLGILALSLGGGCKKKRKPGVVIPLGQAVKSRGGGLKPRGAGLSGRRAPALPNGKGRAGQKRRYLMEKVDRYALVQLYVEGFDKLTLNQKRVAYHLYRAALMGRDITYDQNHRQALKIRNILEGLIKHGRNIAPGVLGKLERYLKLFWVNNGMYKDRTKQKFKPAFTFAELVEAARAAIKGGASLGFTAARAGKALSQLRRTIFDLNFEPYVTNKNPPPGEDILTASANNYYSGVRLKDLAGFKEQNPLNSRLVMKDGKLEEQIYRAGRRGVAPGRYARRLKAVNRELKEATRYASPSQAAVLRYLIEYFETGDLKTFDQANIAWLKDNSAVDLILGFIEVYKDARGQKGEFEAVVMIPDRKLTSLMRAVAANAQYFEDRMPWLAKYKKRGVRTPVANAVQVLLGVGGAGPGCPAGINLPNSQKIRQQYGSKSVLLTNVMLSARMAIGQSALKEFALESEWAAARRYRRNLVNALVAFHEVIGHGSGKVEPQVDKPARFIKEFYSTLEEARADLIALHHAFDPRTVALKILPHKDAAEAMLRWFVRGALVMLRRIPTGRIQDDHMRARQLIVQYLMRKTGAVRTRRLGGKTFFQVRDLKKARQGLAELLAEVMRIKAQGDYRGAKKLVETYGINIDITLRNEIRRRARAIGLPDFFGFVMPQLQAVREASGRITDVKVTYPGSFKEQMLYFKEVH